jgi:hypothetical protein
MPLLRAVELGVDVDTEIYDVSAGGDVFVDVGDEQNL